MPKMSLLPSRSAQPSAVQRGSCQCGVTFVPKLQAGLLARVRSQASGDQGMVQREVKDSAVKAYFLSHPWTFALAASLPGLPPSRALPGQLPLGTTSEKPSWVLRLE